MRCAVGHGDAEHVWDRGCDDEDGNARYVVPHDHR
jgi:hypothetical protein